VGEPTALKTARQIAQETIATHQPEPISEGVKQALQTIIDEADARAGVSA
jgi:trimethylamine:corrinoid methyltransferase-like protein